MLLYEETPLSEAQLPPVYLSPQPCERTMIHQANKRRRDDSITGVIWRTENPRRFASVDVVSSVHNRVCNSADVAPLKRDRLADLLQKPSTPLPTSQQKQVIRELVLLEHSIIVSLQLTPRSLFDSGKRRPPSPPPPHNEDMIYEGPEWSIIEDYVMLHVSKNAYRANTELTLVGHQRGAKYGVQPHLDQSRSCAQLETSVNRGVSSHGSLSFAAAVLHPIYGDYVRIVKTSYPHFYSWSYCLEKNTASSRMIPSRARHADVHCRNMRRVRGKHTKCAL